MLQGSDRERLVLCVLTSGPASYPKAAGGTTTSESPLHVPNSGRDFWMLQGTPSSPVSSVSGLHWKHSPDE